MFRSFGQELLERRLGRRDFFLGKRLTFLICLIATHVLNLLPIYGREVQEKIRNLLHAQNFAVATGRGSVNIYAGLMPFGKYTLTSKSGKVSCDIPDILLRSSTKKHVEGTSTKNKTGILTVFSGSGDISYALKKLWSHCLDLVHLANALSVITF